MSDQKKRRPTLTNNVIGGIELILERVEVNAKARKGSPLLPSSNPVEIANYRRAAKYLRDLAEWHEAKRHNK